MSDFNKNQNSEPAAQVQQRAFPGAYRQAENSETSAEGSLPEAQAPENDLSAATEENDYDNGYGVKSGSNVQTKGVRHFTEGGYEISVFPVDML